MPIFHPLTLLFLSLFLVYGQASAVCKVTVDRRTLAVECLGKSGLPEIQMPVEEFSIEFRAKGPGPRTIERFRFKLEGLDSEWREVRSPMRLSVVFYDAKGAWLAQSDFPVVGTSPGWTGSANTSPLIPMRVTAVVPPGAVKFSVFSSSAGLPKQSDTSRSGHWSYQKRALKIAHLWLR